MKAETARIETAWHEAAHVVVALRLGGSVTGPVSIEPGAHLLGVAHTSTLRASAAAFEELDVGAALPCWDADVRREFEHEIMVVLAGQLAARDDVITAYTADGDPTTRVRAALDQGLAAIDTAVTAGTDRPGRIRLSHDDRAAIDHALAEPPPSDDDQARESATFLVSDERVPALLAFLRSETLYLLRLPHVRVDVERLALELLRRETLSAEDVHSLLAKEAQP